VGVCVWGGGARATKLRSRLWPRPAPRQAGASGLPAEPPGRFCGGARPTRLSLHGRPAPLTRPFYAWPHPAFLCIPKHRRGAGVYTLSWAGGIAQKLIAMCEHWLPLEIANVSPSFLLQMLHVKNTDWTLRFGALASVGSRDPIRGALPLLGPAAGSVGSLRRTSQRRVFRCETSADFVVSAVE
jgi:hypothetical protein